MLMIRLKQTGRWWVDRGGMESGGGEVDTKLYHHENEKKKEKKREKKKKIHRGMTVHRTIKDWWLISQRIVIHEVGVFYYHSQYPSTAKAKHAKTRSIVLAINSHWLARYMQASRHAQHCSTLSTPL